MKTDDSPWSKSSQIRKSYAAASSVTLPKHRKLSQKIPSMLGTSGSSRNRRYRQQRSAFGSEGREKERQLRKEKYEKVDKVRFSIEQLLELAKSAHLERRVILNDEHFEGFQRSGTDAVFPVLLESFDSKKHTNEWYESVKKERIEKTKRFHERVGEKPSQKAQNQNVWRSPAWNHEPPPTHSPQTLDLEKLSKMTAKMTRGKEVFELSDMSKQSQRFEEENRAKQEEMPSFFKTEEQQEQDGLDDVLNSALEDVTRPPAEEVVPLPGFKPDSERDLREKERLWREQEYYRREEEYRLRLKQQQVQQQETEWFYRDPQGNIQGPYNSKTMRTWLERKFFKDDLPIAQNSPRNGFVPIRHLFPDPRTAFLHPPHFPPHSSPEQNYFNQRRREEEELDRLSSFDFAKLQSQTQAKTDESSFTDFLDLDQSVVPPPVVTPVVEKEKEKEKKILNVKSKREEKKRGSELPQKLEGLSDNLKKMLGVSKPKKKREKEDLIKSSISPPVVVKVNPWKKTGGVKSGKSLRQIQEEEQQRLKQNILNGTHQPSQSKVWANLVAKNASLSLHSTSTSTATVTSLPSSTPLVLPLSQEKRKKFLNWYKSSCIHLKLGFDERLFVMAVQMDKPSDVRTLFNKQFGSSPPVSKFATEFLNMKEKLCN